MKKTDFFFFFFWFQERRSGGKKRDFEGRLVKVEGEGKWVRSNEWRGWDFGSEKDAKRKFNETKNNKNLFSGKEFLSSSFS